MSNHTKDAVVSASRNLTDAKRFVKNASHEALIVKDAKLTEKVNDVAKSIDEAVAYISSRMGEKV